jgi:hypothetical protein
MTFDTATSSIVIIAVLASAKVACFTMRMNAVSQLERVNTRTIECFYDGSALLLTGHEGNQVSMPEAARA